MVSKWRPADYAVDVLPAIASEREVLEEEGPTPFEQALPRGAHNEEEEAFLRSVALLRTALSVVVERVSEPVGPPLGVVLQPGQAVAPLGGVAPSQVVPRPASAPPGDVRREAQQAVTPQGSKAGRFPKPAPPAYLLQKAREKAALERLHERAVEGWLATATPGAASSSHEAGLAGAPPRSTPTSHMAEPAGAPRVERADELEYHVQ